MNNVSHNNKWNKGEVQIHVDPPRIPLIKIKNYDKSDKYFVILKLCKDPKSENSDFYELKMYFFDKIDPEDFLLFFWNFNMTL